jgi:uncharacterized protein (TIGR03435 family)
MATIVDARLTSTIPGAVTIATIGWLLFLGLPLSAQQAATTNASQSHFDVVSIKENTGSDLSIRFNPQSPDGYRQSNMPLASYITYAFNIPQPSRLTGLPEWTRTTRYDIAAKATRPISEDERRAMVRDVLVSRFGLHMHFESRLQTVFVMTAARADHRLGPGLKPRPDCVTNTCNAGGTGRPDGIEIQATTLTQLADGLLSALLQQVVRDETGIPGRFDVSASWRPESAAVDPNDSRPSLFTAIQEQLGLKLESQRRTVDVLVIDAVERPTPD